MSLFHNFASRLDASNRRLARVWRDPVGRWIYIFGLLAAGTVVLMAGRPHFSNASVPVRFAWPLVDIQFVASVEELDLILGEAPSPDRETMRLKTYLDFAAIVFYTGMLVTLGLVARRGASWRRIAATVALIGSIAVGMFDAVENRAILALLDVKLGQVTPGMLEAVRMASFVKWSLLAIVAGLLVSALWPARTHAGVRNLKTT